MWTGEHPGQGHDFNWFKSLCTEHELGNLEAA